MIKLFYTLLVIEYVVAEQNISTTVLFESEQACYDHMGNGVLDDLYDVLADTYGKEIMMYCKRTPFMSRDIVKPSLRPVE
tara:strand:- start:86 stop:325 length:240 start_codon:yes stop_codon:yes gene_type:complete